MEAVKPVYLIAGGLVLAAVVMSRAGSVSDAGRAVGGVVVDMVNGVVSGTVEAVGEKVGIPRTEKTRGQAAWDRGDYWEASFYLPAGDFLGNIWKGVTQ